MTDTLPAPLEFALGANTDELLSREYLVTNRLGSYASSTILAANTRRYHGLLVAATQPPVGRLVTLSCLLDQLVVSARGKADTAFDLSTFEFVGNLIPDARPHLVSFRDDLAATFLYRCAGLQLVKEIILAESANAVAVRYRLLDATAAPPCRIRLRPFIALRDYHQLRRAHDGRAFTFSRLTGAEARIRVDLVHGEQPTLFLDAASAGRPGGRGAQFAPDPQWWYRFRYRADIARGQDGLEDLYAPGLFEAALEAGRCVQLTCSLDELVPVDFDQALAQKRARLTRVVEGLGEADEFSRRLAAAGDAFVVLRRRATGEAMISGGAYAARGGAPTILAGYHWFADWGRDAMISLPGLLLETRRYEEALGVLRLFASALDQGLVTNCFDERGGPPRFNSIDASLWFVLAADRYAQAISAGGPDAPWPDGLAPAVDKILQAYHDGTRFDIHADADGLLTGGDANTQLTWMDVKFNDQAVTPRWGKCVEINALWHAALRAAARRATDPRRKDQYSAQARQVADAYAPTFWNEHARCLYDCVTPESKDDSIRPNQVIAISLPHCPLSRERRRAVLEVARRDLLTPLGLRTLSPRCPGYRGQYGSSWESRDRAYHQGTVWPWLIGPFVEAHLRTHDFSPEARRQGRQWLEAFEQHLAQAGVGSISEICEGDAPHRPVGCIAQAWSVAEVLRAWRMCRA